MDGWRGSNSDSLPTDVMSPNSGPSQGAFRYHVCIVGGHRKVDLVSEVA